MGSEWIDAVADALVDAGHARGGARDAIVALLDAQGCALSAIEIEGQLRASGTRRVSRATVYRVLEELEGLGLVARLDLGRNALARFEPVRPDGHHHHHLICTDCGTVLPFEDAKLERAIQRVSRDVDFAVSGHEIVLHGACGDCSG